MIIRAIAILAAMPLPGSNGPLSTTAVTHAWFSTAAGN